MKCFITKSGKPICKIVDELKYWKKECKSFQIQLVKSDEANIQLAVGLKLKDEELRDLQEAYDLAMREINKLREKIK